MNRGGVYVLMSVRARTHPKINALSDGAHRLWVNGLAFCADHLTDGVILHSDVPTLHPAYKPRYLRELVEAGVWIECPERPKRYEVHDYLDWNYSRAEVMALRETKARAGRRGAEARWGHE